MKALILLMGLLLSGCIDTDDTSIVKCDNCDKIVTVSDAEILMVCQSGRCVIGLDCDLTPTLLSCENYRWFEKDTATLIVEEHIKNTSSPTPIFNRSLNESEIKEIYLKQRD